MTPDVVVSGVACMSDFAESTQEFYRHIKEKKCVEFEHAFDDKVVQEELFGFRFNPKLAAMTALRTRYKTHYKRFGIDDDRLALLLKATNAILRDAGFGREILADDRTRVIWGAPGNQPDLRAFFMHLQANDKLDLLLNPRLKELHCKHFSNEFLTTDFAKYYDLKYPVSTLSSACSSSITALINAMMMLKTREVDRVLLLSWQEVSTFDLLFMSGLNILAEEKSLPFLTATQGIIPAFGIAGIMLEKTQVCKARGRKAYFKIKSVHAQRSTSGTSQTPSMQIAFRDLAKLYDNTLEKANLTAADIDAVFPHGNGIRASDNAELLAMAKVFGEYSPAVANYTYQTGYFLAASGAFDLIIAANSFRQQKIDPFVSPEPILGSGLNFISNTSESLNLQYLLKSSIGIDGSLAATVLANVEAERY